MACCFLLYPPHTALGWPVSNLPRDIREGKKLCSTGEESSPGAYVYTYSLKSAPTSRLGNPAIKQEWDQ